MVPSILLPATWCWRKRAARGPFPAAAERAVGDSLDSVPAEQGSMSGKEPLLGTLKACILSFQEASSPYPDTCPHLQSFCEILEMILRKGLKQPVLGFKRKDYWHWIEQLPQQQTSHSRILLSMIIEKTNSCEKVLTAQGRGRYFLRLALNGKLLAVAVQQLLRIPRLLECYDPVTSILANEEFSEPFLSMMLVVTEMNFSLDLQNSSFLDESWQLPMLKTTWHFGWNLIFIQYCQN